MSVAEHARAYTQPPRSRCAARRRPERPVAGSARPETPTRPRSAALDAPGPVSGLVSSSPHRAVRPARAPDGRFTPPGMIAVVSALPAGSRRAQTQTEALQAWEAHPARLEIRSDRDRRLGQVWQAIVHRADWSTMTWTGTWDALAEQVGVSRSTIARAVRWLRAVGLLGIVHTGASAEALGGDTNRAPTYVLAIPHGLIAPAQTPVDEPATPTGLGFDLSNQHTREARSPSTAPLRGLGSAPKPDDVDRLLAVHPPTKRDRLRAAEALRWWSPILRRMSARMLRHLLRPWWDAGWSPRDVLYALDHRPDGTPWRNAAGIRTPAAWIRHRLAAWLDGGEPTPSRSQRAAAAAVRPRVIREARPSWREDLDGRRVDPNACTGAALARAVAAQAAARTRAHGA